MFYEVFVGFQKKYAFDEIGSTLFAYDFPNQVGMVGDQKTHKVVSIYLAVLYLRMWKISARYGGPINLQYRLDPGEDRGAWIRNLKYLKRLVIEVQADKELKQALGISGINEESCRAKNQPLPVEEIEMLIDHLDRLNVVDKVNLTISDGYIEIFRSTAIEILAPALSTLEEISTKKEIRKSDSVLYVNGGTAIFEKEAFINMLNPELNGSNNVVASHSFRKISSIRSKLNG